MSTRCQIEFRNGAVRRTVYRHSDGYPSAVIEDLLAFLQWSVRGGDVEYEAANFLYWSKREIARRYPQHEQLGFGICENDELHGDVEYYYVVEHTPAGVLVRAFEVEDGRTARCVDSLAVPGARSFLSSPARAAAWSAVEIGRTTLRFSPTPHLTDRQPKGRGCFLDIGFVILLKARCWT